MGRAFSLVNPSLLNEFIGLVKYQGDKQYQSIL